MEGGQGRRPVDVTSRPKGPGLVNGSLAGVLVILVAAVALTARQPAPPAIAELAPQAAQQIKDSLKEQSSQFGSGPGSEAGGNFEGGSTTTSTTVATTDTTEEEKPIDRGRVRRCIGDPPRQTEDPQSPPCVPYFEGDNGGETWRGVTAREIRVAWPKSWSAQTDALMNAMVSYFNTRYEFYGRKIRLIPVQPSATADPAALQADAVKVDTEADPFASLAYSQETNLGNQYPYYDELARRKIMSFSMRANFAPPGQMDKWAPYQWSLVPEYPTFARRLAEFLCKSLNGRTADYAGGSQLGKQRAFGLVYETMSHDAPLNIDPEIMKRALSSTCGATFSAVQQSDGTASSIPNVVLAMKSATPQVTTIVCLCDGSQAVPTYMRTATAQDYYPEWMSTNYVYLDNLFLTATYYPAEQRRHFFGLSFDNRFNPQADMPFRWALNEAGGDAGSGYDVNYFTYLNLLQLATGIQLAGPNLTPHTFEQGMFNATFPNPGCLGAPHYQACVDYGPGDHVQQDDALLTWWAEGETWQGENTAGTGTFCYVNRGTRYRAGEFPTSGITFFQPPCL